MEARAVMLAGVAAGTMQPPPRATTMTSTPAPINDDPEHGDTSAGTRSALRLCDITGMPLPPKVLSPDSFCRLRSQLCFSQCIGYSVSEACADLLALAGRSHRLFQVVSHAQES